MRKREYTELSNKELVFMGGNGGVATRVRFGPYSNESENFSFHRKYAYLAMELDHFGSASKMEFPLNHKNIAILIEMLQEAQEFLGVPEDELLFHDSPRLYKAEDEGFDFWFHGKESGERIEHPLAPIRKKATAEKGCSEACEKSCSEG